MIAFFDGLTSAAAAILGALAGLVLGICATVIVYEGIAIPLPIVGEVHLINGRVRNAVNHARSGMVAQAQYDALAAQKLKAQRDAKIGADALDVARKAADAAQVEAEKQAAEDAVIISAYEATRTVKCPLTVQDWDFIEGKGK